MRDVGAVIGVIMLFAMLFIGGIVFSQLAHMVDPKLIGAPYSEQVLVNSTASLGPYQLTHYPIIQGTLVLSIGSTIYQEGVDYTVDYTNGTFTIIAGSSLASATATSTYVNASYKYEGGQAWDTYVNIQNTGWASLNLFIIAGIVMAAGFILALLIAWGRAGMGGSGGV